MSVPERKTGRRPEDDLIAMFPQDPWERALPDVGLLRLADPETGRTLLIDTSDAAFRRAYEDRARRREETLRQCARGARIDWIDVATDGGHLDVLQKFFDRRRHRHGATISRGVSTGCSAG